MPEQEGEKRRIAGLLLAASCSLVCITSFAAVSGQQPPLQAGTRTHRGSDPYTGIVTNQTITAAGTDFFQAFVSAWRNVPNSGAYSLSVHEQPSARWGTHVWIVYGVHRVFQLQLPAARAAARELGMRAAPVVLRRVVDQDVARALFRDVDLGRDEL